MYHKPPHLDKSMVNSWLREREEKDATIARIVNGDPTQAQLQALYMDLTDAVAREFPARKYGLESADLKKVVLNFLDPFQKRWPEHALVHHREWPRFDPERHTI